MRTIVTFFSVLLLACGAASCQKADSERPWGSAVIYMPQAGYIPYAVPNGGTAQQSNKNYRIDAQAGKVHIFLGIYRAGLAEGKPKTADAIRNFERLHSLPVHICTDGSVLETQSFAAVVDALYGTGFHGELRPSGLAACGLIRRLHKGGAFVLAVDLPSGINTDTGEVAEGAAHADLTVAFDSYKPLHIAETSAPQCGKIVCADIGIRDEWHPEF